MAACRDCVAEFLLELPCGCANFCLECTIIKIKDQGKVIAWGEPMPACPQCEQAIPIPTLIEIAKGSTYEDEFEHIFGLFPALKTISGINFCPRNGCLFAGWVDTQKTCWGPVECEKCGEKWIDQQTIPKWYRAYRWCRDMATGEHEVFNALWKEVWSDPCPRCGVYIQKTCNASCYSLVCPICSLRFCWPCHTRFDYTHRHSDAAFRIGVIIIVVLIGILLCALKTMSVLYLLHSTPGVLFTIAIHIAAFITSVLTDAFLFMIFDQPSDTKRTFGLCFVYGVIIAIVGSFTYAGKQLIETTSTLVVTAAHCSLGLAYKRYKSF